VWARGAATGELRSPVKPNAQAEQILPGDPQLDQIAKSLTRFTSVESMPAGARVEIQDYLSPGLNETPGSPGSALPENHVFPPPTPLEILPRRFQPAAVLTHSVFAANDVVMAPCRALTAPIPCGLSAPIVSGRNMGLERLRFWGSAWVIGP
jgi:hypothetical protein